jgi:hypothetical protein
MNKIKLVYDTKHFLLRMVGKVRRQAKHAAQSIVMSVWIAPPESRGGTTLPHPPHEGSVGGPTHFKTEATHALLRPGWIPRARGVGWLQAGHTPLAPTTRGKNSNATPGHLRRAAPRTWCCRIPPAYDAIPGSNLIPLPRRSGHRRRRRHRGSGKPQGRVCTECHPDVARGAPPGPPSRPSDTGWRSSWPRRCGAGRGSHGPQGRPARCGTRSHRRRSLPGTS